MPTVHIYSASPKLVPLDQNIPVPTFPLLLERPVQAFHVFTVSSPFVGLRKLVRTTASIPKMPRHDPVEEPVSSSLILNRWFIMFSMSLTVTPNLKQNYAQIPCSFAHYDVSMLQVTTFTEYLLSTPLRFIIRTRVTQV